MKKCRLAVLIIFLVFGSRFVAEGGSSNQLYNLPPELTQSQGEGKVSSIDFADVPRVSAREAALMFRAGKAILIQAGGESYERRHIIGAVDLRSEAAQSGNVQVNFPFEGIEIITYCF